MLALLQTIFGTDSAREVLPRIQTLLDAQPRHSRTPELSQRDVLLIAYADHLAAGGGPPLQRLSAFTGYAGGIITGLHLLPFHPAVGDGGFAVSDHLAVDPRLGSWDDIAALGMQHRLMVDCILNHVSTQHPWFQAFVDGDPRYSDYFITLDPQTDLDAVPAPRPGTTVSLTPFETATGTKHVWTTFGPSLVDLNYANPDVLLEAIAVVLASVAHGARMVRLPAVDRLWKTPGTSCRHLPQTHAIVQLLRAVLDTVDPSVQIVTATNASHTDNISYFGNGGNEAQLVTNYALPPLLLHTLHQGDARGLTMWASLLSAPSATTGYFHFSASHDGIEARPIAGVLSQDAVSSLVQRVIAHGGKVRPAPSDREHAYELNVTYFDALSSPEDHGDLAIDRFMVSQAIVLCLAGVAGIYLPSLFGASTRPIDSATTGDERDGNRQRFDLGRLSKELNDPQSRAAKILLRYRELLLMRQTQAAFHPQAPQVVLDYGAPVFVVERTARDGKSQVLAVHNVTAQPSSLRLPRRGEWFDLVREYEPDSTVTLDPYQFAWLYRPL